MKAAGPLNLPSVRDEGPVSVRRDTNSPEAAGFMRAAQARASGGEAIARGVQAFAAGIDKMAEDRDRAKALAAYNDYVTKSSELLYNADSGFMNAQGAGAEGLAYRVNEAHNTLRGEVAEGLSSRQRRLFMESAASYDRDVARSAMRYEGRAMAEYRRTEGARTLENMAAAFAAAPDDISIETQEESIYSVTMALFGDQGEEANAANVRSVRSDFISKAALLMAERDPLRAEAFVRENAGLMDEAAAENVRLKVEAAALEAHLQEDTPKLFEEYGFDGLEGARAFIRDNYSGTEENKRVTAAESYWREQWSDRKFREEQYADEILGMMDSGASLKAVNDAIDSFAWSSNGARRAMERERDAHFRVGDYASGRAGFRIDWDAVAEVDELRNSGKILDVCPTMADFRERYGDKVGSEVLNEFRKYYNRLRRGESDVEVKMEIGYTSIFKDKLKKAGIKDISEQERWKAIYQSHFEAMKNDKDKSGPITPEMAIELMDMILAPEVVGTRRNAAGRAVERRVRRGYIPPEAEQVGGRWYIKDADGRYHELFFPDGSGVDIDGGAEVSPQGFDGIPMGTISAPVPDEAEIWRR
ncbi:hypothetical protein [uncultured Cloacibacillus sp.]|uniref:hypothetical protein n=1 Tax=uncultured Cloacibacillus sp. TaxID=889794 RepID=UPI002622A8DC|nr:hypothetical protein [uncultured Cloacibacillus sp.]